MRATAISMALGMCLTTGVFSSASMAQAPKPAPAPVAPAKPAAQPAPVDSEPQNTSATFGDWVERCQKLPPGAEVARACEVAQSIQGQGQGQSQGGTVAEIALGRLKKGDALHLTVVLPVNVTFPSAPRISVDGDEQSSMDLTWRRCVPGGCFADAVFKDETLKRWKTAAATGKIVTKDSGDRDIAIAVSFRGLAQALDALAKEP